MLLSNRSKFAVNIIEEEDKLADELEIMGKKIYRLNRGDPAKYFPTPKYIIKAYEKALEEGITSYTPAEGTIKLRDAIVGRYKNLYGVKLNQKDIIVTAGVTEALSFLNSALIDKSDLAIMFKPYYALYTTSLKINGGEILMEKYDEKNKWNIDTDSLKKSLMAAKKNKKLDKVKYMLITNPNNPTGTVLDMSILREVVDLANEYDILLISDEIYDEIIYNKAKFTSISQLAKGVPHVILNGASKVYDATGFRIGFMIIPENDKKSEMLKNKLYNYALTRLSVNSPAQFAIAEGISNLKEHKKSINSMVKAIETRANYATKLLKENPLLETVAPNGAFYILPRINLQKMRLKNDKEFVELLLKEYGIQVTRGSGFGADSHFRIVALPPKEILDYTINKINTLCKEYSK
jgi:alanine-synthesizing transaminase